MRKFKGIISTPLVILIIAAVIILLAIVYFLKPGLFKRATSSNSTNIGQQQSEASTSGSITTDLGVASIEDVPQGQTTPGTAGSGMAGYQNSELGFKVSYPDGWSTGTYTLKIGYGSVVSTSGSAVAFSPNPAPTSTDRNTLLAAYLKSPITVILFNQPISKFGDITKNGTATVVDGKQAVKISNSAKGTQNIYVTKDDSSTFEIVFNPAYGGDAQLFNRVLNSFTIL